MENDLFYVYHHETFPSGNVATIVEPFEFDDPAKAHEFAVCLATISNNLTQYKVTDDLQSIGIR